jgi:hypothetical protein
MEERVLASLRQRLWWLEGFARCMTHPALLEYVSDFKKFLLREAITSPHREEEEVAAEKDRKDASERSEDHKKGEGYEPGNGERGEEAAGEGRGASSFPYDSKGRPTPLEGS